MVRGRRYCIVDMDIEIDSKFKDQGNRYIITVHITLLARGEQLEYIISLLS